MSKAANEVRVYLQNLVGKSWRPLPAVAKALPDDIHEQVSEEYGGLKNFFQSNPQLFELELQQSVFSVRLRPVKIPHAPTINPNLGTQQRSQPQTGVQQQTVVPPPVVVMNDLRSSSITRTLLRSQRRPFRGFPHSPFQFPLSLKRKIDRLLT
jgi:hypothetical protein